MAVDSRDKRFSLLGLVAGLALVLPNPDGLALDQGDRQQTAFCYRGIVAAAPVESASDVVSPAIMVRRQVDTLAATNRHLDLTIAIRRQVDLTVER